VVQGPPSPVEGEGKIGAPVGEEGNIGAPAEGEGGKRVSFLPHYVSMIPGSLGILFMLVIMLNLGRIRVLHTAYQLEVLKSALGNPGLLLAVEQGNVFISVLGKDHFSRGEGDHH